MHSMITSALKRIWRDKVGEDFRSGLIASERELQACLYSHLREELHATALGHARIFVEPTLHGMDGRELSRYPDMLVCAPNEADRGMEILAVVELKLDRGKFIRFEEELARIVELGTHPRVSTAIDVLQDARRQLPLILSDSTHFFLGFLGSNDAEAVHEAHLRKSSDGAAFLANYPILASRTTLLYGRVHRDGATLFGSGRLEAIAAGEVA